MGKRMHNKPNHSHPHMPVKGVHPISFLSTGFFFIENINPGVRNNEPGGRNFFWQTGYLQSITVSHLKLFGKDSTDGHHRQICAKPYPEASGP